ncbi:MAG: HEAT repeat domain-containing protein [Candidatus Wallbacteria bacterium]|nr:HEAT repeat domain-containing protein [Candidatus Wallbacteria bacterium]
MSLKIQRIVEDLADVDAEIQTLALTTLTRISLDDTVTPAQLTELRNRLASLCSTSNGDIAFLAKKALNYVDGGARSQAPATPAQPATRPPAPEASPKQLMAELARESEPMRIATVLTQLIRSGDASMLGEIAKFLKHDDDRVRANAVEVFEKLGDRTHIPLLVPILNDPTNRVKANVVKALGRFGDPQVREYLSSMLESDKVAMRESAVYAISQLGKLDLEDLLIRAASDAYEGVRLRVVKCLADFSSEKAIAALTRRIDDNDPSVRQQALDILAAKGVNVQELVEQRRELGLVDAASNLPYIPTPVAKPSAEDEGFQARVREKVEKTFKLEILNIAQELREGEMKARMARLLFKIGVDAFEMCRRGELKDKALMVHYYEITKYQDFLRSLSKKSAESADGLKTQVLSAGLEQYRAKMRASFVRLGKALAQAHRSGAIRVEETPELQQFGRLIG